LLSSSATKTSHHYVDDDVVVIPGGTKTVVEETTTYHPVQVVDDPVDKEHTTRFARWAKEREEHCSGDHGGKHCSGKKECRISYHDENGNHSGDYGFLVCNFKDGRTFEGEGADPDGEFRIEGGRVNANQIRWRAVMKNDPSTIAEFNGTKMPGMDKYKCEFLVNKGFSGSAILSFEQASV
jgi:hypothetical protein